VTGDMPKAMGTKSYVDTPPPYCPSTWLFRQPVTEASNRLALSNQ